MLGVRQFLPVRRPLQVEVDAGAFSGNLSSQGGLARLARAEQGDCRELFQPGMDGRQFLARNHPSNYGILFHKYKDKILFSGIRPESQCHDPGMRHDIHPHVDSAFEEGAALRQVDLDVLKPQGLPGF